MATIYAVTRGEYSDYGVVALFDKYYKAQEFIDCFGEADRSYDEFNDIEEYELNPDTVNLFHKGYKPWNVLMLKNGDTEEVREGDETLFFNIEKAMNAEAWVWPRSRAYAFKGKGYSDCLKVSCLARGPKHAVKIANEKRLQFLSMGWW